MPSILRAAAIFSLTITFAWTSQAHEGHHHEDSETEQAAVIEHDEVKVFENNGNLLRGIATLGTGAREFEVWRSNVAVGSSTPKHVHDSEEVFVFGA